MYIFPDIEHPDAAQNNLRGAAQKGHGHQRVAPGPQQRQQPQHLEAQGINGAAAGLRVAVDGAQGGPPEQQGEEAEKLPALLERGGEIITSFVLQGIIRTMNTFNTDRK